MIRLWRATRSFWRLAMGRIQTRSSRHDSECEYCERRQRRGKGMRSCPGGVIILVLCTAATLFADVAKVKAEPNLERRSALALDEAESMLTAARKSYDGGQIEQFKSELKQTAELIDLSYDSLQETGKNARRSPKWFKRAEQRLLYMLRRVDALQRDVAIEDKPFV